jgi:hypothetical protein
MINAQTLQRKINSEKHNGISRSEILTNRIKVIIFGILFVLFINSLTVAAGSSTIRKEPKRVVSMVKKKSKGVAAWEPSIRKKIENHQLHGNNSILYYHFSGNKTYAAACKEIVDEIKEAKTRSQYPFDVCYVYYDGLIRINGRLFHQFSLYQTTKQVLANPNGIPPALK